MPDFRLYHSPVVYPSFIILMSWHQHFLGTPKIWYCHFLLPASSLAKYFISMVLSLFLGTVFMLLCVQTQYVLITLWCLHKGEIQCPPPHFTIRSEGPVLDSVLENFSMAVGRSCNPPASYRQLSPMTSAPPRTRIHHCHNLKHMPFHMTHWTVIPPR